MSVRVVVEIVDCMVLIEDASDVKEKCEYELEDLRKDVRDMVGDVVCERGRASV
jgi:hypothetical protein